MRVVRAPDRALREVRPGLADQSRPDDVLLEAHRDLPREILTGPQAERGGGIGRPLALLAVHPLHEIGEPAHVALTEGDPQPRVALQRPAEDDLGQAAEHAAHRRTGEVRLGGAVQVGRVGRAGLVADVAADGQARLLRRLPHRLPRGLVDRHADVVQTELHALRPQLGHAPQLGDAGFGELGRQHRQDDKPLWRVAGQLQEKVVVGAVAFPQQLGIGDRPFPRVAVDHAGIDVGKVHVREEQRRVRGGQGAFGRLDAALAERPLAAHGVVPPVGGGQLQLVLPFPERAAVRLDNPGRRVLPA